MVESYPNDAGFEDAPEACTPMSLPIEGKIPDYVRGRLYRTGPGRYTIETKRNKKFNVAHWFDGFTLNHKFEIKDGSVMYTSKYGCDDRINHVAQTGHLGDLFSFAQPRDPCESLFHKFSCVFKQTDLVTSPSMANVGVSMSHTTNGKVIMRTDGNHVQTINDETLVPETYSTYSPKMKGQCSAAHGASDLHTGEYYNYLLDLKSSKYTVFRSKQQDRNLGSHLERKSFLYPFLVSYAQLSYSHGLASIHPNNARRY